MMITHNQSPAHTTYDIVIIGGGIMGSAAAWFLTQDPAFDGRILVVERDPTYAQASTSHTNSCMRQQFSSALNIQISQFAADFVTHLPDYMGHSPDIPDLRINNFGYLYLADTSAFADTLRANLAVQHANGAGTQLLDPAQIAAAFPFFQLDDILLGSLNTKDEGYFDGAVLFDCWKREARRAGVTYLTNEVVAMTRNAAGDAVDSVTLRSGEVVGCGQVVNASGPRAVLTARMAGITVPVEPRKRHTWIFKAEKPLDRPLPLTIDPSGVHVRENGGGTYLAGGHTDVDPGVDYDDFAMDHSLWMEHAWPLLATRIPQFEAVKITSEWAGHYAFNTFDQNAIIGPHPDVANFYFLNGFSGHGLQQSPAMGRGMAEILVHGAYQTLDLQPFGFDRIVAGARYVEKAVI